MARSALVAKVRQPKHPSFRRRPIAGYSLRRVSGRRQCSGHGDAQALRTRRKSFPAWSHAVWYSVHNGTPALLRSLSVADSACSIVQAARPPGYNGYDLLIKHFNIAGSTPSERVEQLRKVSAEDLVAFLPKVKPRPSGWQWVPTIQTTEDATWPFSSGAACK